jgi:hypothetical protein
LYTAPKIILRGRAAPDGSQLLAVLRECLLHLGLALLDWAVLPAPRELVVRDVDHEEDVRLQLGRRQRRGLGARVCSEYGGTLFGKRQAERA